MNYRNPATILPKTPINASQPSNVPSAYYVQQCMCSWVTEKEGAVAMRKAILLSQALYDDFFFSKQSKLWKSLSHLMAERSYLFL